jgi:hypothetical protein
MKSQNIGVVEIQKNLKMFSKILTKGFGLSVIVGIHLMHN